MSSSYTSVALPEVTSVLVRSDRHQMHVMAKAEVVSESQGTPQTAAATRTTERPGRGPRRRPLVPNTAKGHRPAHM